MQRSAGVAALVAGIALFALLVPDGEPRDVALLDRNSIPDAALSAPTSHAAPGAQRTKLDGASTPVAHEQREAALLLRATSTAPTLSGRIIDQDENGIAGVTVQVVGLGIDGQPGRWRSLPPWGQLVAEDVELSALPQTTTCQEGYWEIALPQSFADVDEGEFEGPATMLLVEGDGLTRTVHAVYEEAQVDDIELGPPLTLTGRAADERGNAVAGVRVWAFVEEGTSSSSWSTDYIEGWSSTRTGADGRFTLSGLVPGGHGLWFDGDHVVGRWKELELHGPGVSDIGDVLVHAGGTVTGRVVDDTGHPIPGAEIATCSLHAGDFEPLETYTDIRIAHEAILKIPAPHVFTDSNGGFRLDGVSQRRALVTAWSPGFGIASNVATLDGRRAHIEFVLPRAPRTFVQVVNSETGQPFPIESIDFDAEVLTALDGPGPGSYETRTYGEARVETTDEGFFIEHQGPLGSDVSIDVKDFISKDVVIKKDVRDVTIELQRGAVITGHVTNEGHPARARVTATRGRQTHTTTTDEHGGFRFAGLHFTPHVLSAEGLVASRRATKRVELIEGGTAPDISLALESTGTIRLMVVHPDKLATHQLDLLHSRTGLQMNVAMETGTDWIPELTAGSWTISGLNFTSVEVDVEPARTISATLSHKGHARIFGRVRRGQEWITTGFICAIDGHRVHGTGSVNADSAFGLEVDGDRSYQLVWMNGANVYIDDTQLSPRWGETLTHDLALTGRSLDVVVRDADTGEPLKFVRIASHGPLPLQTGAPGYTDANGRLHIETLPPDAVAISTVAYHVEFVKVEIGDKHEVEILTRRTGDIDLTVVDLHGEPCTESIRVRIEDMSRGVVEYIELEEDGHWLSGLLGGTKKIIATRAWIDIEALPLGIGTVIEVTPSRYTEVTVPLTY